MNVELTGMKPEENLGEIRCFPGGKKQPDHDQKRPLPNFKPETTKKINESVQPKKDQNKK